MADAKKAGQTRSKVDRTDDRKSVIRSSLKENESFEHAVKDNESFEHAKGTIKK